MNTYHVKAEAAETNTEPYVAETFLIEAKNGREAARIAFERLGRPEIAARMSTARYGGRSTRNYYTNTKRDYHGVSITLFNDATVRLARPYDIERAVADVCAAI